MSTKTALAARVQTRDGFAGLDQLGVVFGNVVGTIATFVGFAVLVMMIVGAFRFMTANGDPKAIGQARGTIFWAIGGLVFVILAFIIIRLIGGFVGCDLDIFVFPDFNNHCG